MGKLMAIMVELMAIMMGSVLAQRVKVAIGSTRNGSAIAIQEHLSPGSLQYVIATETIVQQLSEISLQADRSMRAQ